MSNEEAYLSMLAVTSFHLRGMDQVQTALHIQTYPLLLSSEVMHKSANLL